MRLDVELTELRAQVAMLRQENASLLRLSELSPSEPRAPGAVQTGMFDAAPGMVHVGSSSEAKVAFYAALFACRRDVHAVRWENARLGRSGWMPVVGGGWRKRMPSSERDYLPLTPSVLTAHLSSAVEVGLYPLLDGASARATCRRQIRHGQVVPLRVESVTGKGRSSTSAATRERFGPRPLALREPVRPTRFTGRNTQTRHLGVEN